MRPGAAFRRAGFVLFSAAAFLPVALSAPAPRAAPGPAPAPAAPSAPAALRLGPFRGAGRLVLKDTNGLETEPLEVRTLRIATTVRGPLALTEIEQTFWNPTDRRAEGVFHFAVPPGAALCRLAMYVDGRLMEGEVVEVVRAREVYESIVRRMQDPALMEWQEGSVFRTRIFPIPPRGPKRILVSLAQALPLRGGERRYVQPLAGEGLSGAPVGRLEVDVRLEGIGEGTPVEVPAYPDARIVREAGGVSIRFEKDAFRPAGDFTVRFSPPRAAAFEAYPFRRKGEDGFVCVSCVPPAPPSDSAPRAPRDVAFLLDASMSRGPDECRAQIAFARTLLAASRPEDRFAVLSFDASARRHTEGWADRAGAERALDDVSAISPLGGTDLPEAFRSLDAFLKDNPPRGRAEAVLLGDGVGTIGETAPARIAEGAWAVLRRHGARFHGVLLGARTDRLALESASNATEGVCVSILPGDDVSAAAAAFARALDAGFVAAPTFEFEGLEVRDLHPRASEAVVAGDEILVFGRYSGGGGGTVSLRSGEALSASAEIELPDAGDSNGLVPLLWAKRAADDLLLEPRKPETVRDIVDLSQRFTFATPFASFLVLENDEQYGLFRIDRTKRRGDVDGLRRLRTEAPREERAPPPPVRTILAKRETPPPPPGRKAPAPKRPFLEGLDLRRLHPQTAESRIVETSLSALCLEVYYRYLPIYAVGGGEAEPPISDGSALDAQGWSLAGNVPGPSLPPSPARPPAPPPAMSEPPVPAPARPAESAPVPPGALDVPPAPPPGASPPRIADGPSDRAIAAAREAGAPSATEEATVEFADHVDTQDEVVNMQHLARGEQETISNIPLGDAGAFDFMGVGGGGGGRFGWRDGGGRRNLALRGGGTSASESGGMRSLKFLAASQEPDGRFGGAGTEATSLSLLAFLGAGHTDASPQYGTTVRKTLYFLEMIQKKDGRIGGDAYEHAIAALVLAEAYGMTGKHKEAAQKAVDALVGLQKSSGGWGDGERGDPHATAWAVMALKSAKLSELRVPQEAFENARKYIHSVTSPEGFVGARGAPEGKQIDPLNTSALLLARLFLGQNPAAPNMLTPADLLVTRVAGTRLDRPDAAYLRYFATLALFQVGQGRWERWNAWNRPSLVESQRLVGGEAGSWDPAGVWIRSRRLPVLGGTKEGKAAEISAARAAFRAKPGDPGARDAFAAFLSGVTDAGALSKAIEDARGDPADLRAMLRLRLAMLHSAAGRLEEAARALRAAYDEAGRPENVFEECVLALCDAGKGGEALETLLREEDEGRTGHWRRAMIARLLLASEPGRSDPVGFLNKRLAREPGRHGALKAIVGACAREKGRRADAAALLLEAYRDLDRDESLAVPAFEAMGLAGRREEALAILAREAREDGRFSPARIAAAGRLLAERAGKAEEKEAWVEREFSRVPVARAILFEGLARAAHEGAERALAVRLFGRASSEGGLSERSLREYVQDLRALGDSARVSRELERAVAGGFHDDETLRMLLESYREEKRPPADLLRAASSPAEANPRDPALCVELARFFEDALEPERALEEYARAIRIRPEDPRFYRTVIERAVALGRFDAARSAFEEAVKRFPNPEAIVGDEGREVLALLRKSGGASDAKAGDLERSIRDAFRKDLVITLSWDTQRTDVDLHVSEPGGGDCSYQNMRTAQGGALDRDVTDGLGAEVYVARRAKPGTYRVEARYFFGAPIPTTATVRIVRTEGGKEKVETRTAVLKGSGERATLAEIEIPAGR